MLGTVAARRACALCMIAAPATLLVSIALSPRIVSAPARQLELIAAEPERQYLSSVAALLALALFIPAILGLLERLGPDRRRHAALAAALAFTGTIATAASTALALVEWQMTRGGVRREAMVALLDRIYHSPGLQGVFYASGLLGVGLALLGLGLARAGATPLWAASAIALGALGIDLGFALNSLVLALVAAAALALGLGWSGRLALRAAKGLPR